MSQPWSATAFLNEIRECTCHPFSIIPQQWPHPILLWFRAMQTRPLCDLHLLIRKALMQVLWQNVLLIPLSDRRLIRVDRNIRDPEILCDRPNLKSSAGCQ
jgi:hypothetical protein